MLYVCDFNKPNGSNAKNNTTLNLKKINFETIPFLKLSKIIENNNEK